MQGGGSLYSPLARIHPPDPAGYVPFSANKEGALEDRNVGICREILCHTPPEDGYIEGFRTVWLPTAHPCPGRESLQIDFPLRMT